MRTIIVLMFSLLIFACSSIQDKDLHGTWRGENMEFTLNADNSMELKQGFNTGVKGKYRKAMGNQLELINEEGKVVFNPRITKLTTDTMIIDIPTLGASRLFVLAKQR
jgi:hypothetical protein